MNEWIHGNNTVHSLWHLAQWVEAKGARTGTVYRRYCVTACNRKQLGGAWGYTRETIEPVPEAQCKRCATIAKRQP